MNDKEPINNTKIKIDICIKVLSEDNPDYPDCFKKICLGLRDQTIEYIIKQNLKEMPSFKLEYFVDDFNTPKFEGIGIRKK